MKRAFDVVLGAVAITVTLPLWPVIVVAIRVNSGGPAIYRALRVGRGGQTFEMYKFRTMVSVDPSGGPRITRSGDPRVTAVGRWLRSTKLDELPQLINVLRGDMSIVGPRPEDPHYVALYSEEQRRVLSVRPGIVGPAALEYRHEESILAAGDDLEETYVGVVLPAKLRMDLEYIDHHSMWRDVRILLEAAAALFRRART